MTLYSNSLLSEPSLILGKDVNNLKIVISGAGPAGLACALEAIKNGCIPIILEKRSCEQEGRPQPVILTREVMQQLQIHKIYSYLLEKHLIFPLTKGRCTVRLCDLEKAMRHALEKYAESSSLIRYGDSTETFTDQDGKVNLHLQSGVVIEKVDLVVNAEGWQSRTNELLTNHRIEVVSEHLAVYSILRDDRPKVRNFSTFGEASAKTVRNNTLAIRDHAIYLFLLAFKREHFFSPSRNIAIAATLKTPGQHRVGFSFTKKKTKEIKRMQEAVKAGKISQAELDKILRFWTRMALCEVNVFANLARLGELFGMKENRLLTASHLPIKSTSVIKVRCDRVENAAIVHNKALFLITGDALWTVDPTAVLGCNIAIQLGAQIQNAIEGLKNKTPLDQIAEQYTKTCQKWIENSHQIARGIREQFDPKNQISVEEQLLRAFFSTQPT